jgi:hypothetical protein
MLFDMIKDPEQDYEINGPCNKNKSIFKVYDKVKGSLVINGVQESRNH